MFTRLICLPEDAPIVWLLDEEQKKADAKRRAVEVEDTLAPFKPSPERR